jgi:hypothetical protein
MSHEKGTTPRTPVRSFYDQMAEGLVHMADQRFSKKLAEKLLDAYKHGRRDAKRQLRPDYDEPTLVFDPETGRYSVVVAGVAVYDGLDPLGLREEIRAKASANESEEPKP